MMVSAVAIVKETQTTPTRVTSGMAMAMAIAITATGTTRILCMVVWINGTHKVGGLQRL